MSVRWNMNLQRLFLLTLLPALSVITLAAGSWLYTSLYTVILDGFDRKLYALSTTTASFIDGDELLEVIEPHHVVGLVYDTTQDRLLGLDASRDMLVEIDRETGGAFPIGALGVTGPYSDLAFDPSTRTAYAVSHDADRLMAIDPNSGRANAVMDLPHPVGGLAWDPRRERLVGAGTNTLYAIEVASQTVTTVTSLDASGLTGLVYDQSADLWYGVIGASGLLVEVDVTNGTVTEVGLLIPEGQEYGALEYGEEAGTLPAYGAAMASGAPIWVAADRLMVVDPATGAAETGLWMTSGYCNHEREQFTQFVTPMRAILEEKDVTYLYTFKMGGRKDIVYIVDGSPLDDWCPIGYEEDLPQQNVEGILRAIEEGVPFISDVMDFDLWGLLKVAAAPIYNEEGDIRALAGVDINIDLIQTKTRNALFQVLGFGVLSLLVAGMVSLWITRRLTRPINQLKYGALRIAAGDYTYALAIRNPRELGHLATALNGIGETLQQTIRRMADTSARLEAGRRRTELVKSLARRESGSTHPVHSYWLHDRPQCVDASGSVATDTIAVYWIAPFKGEQLNAVKMRSDIAHTVSAWLPLRPDAATLCVEMHPLFPDTVIAFVIVEQAKEQMHVYARETITIGQRRGRSSLQSLTIPPGVAGHPLEDNSAYYILSSDPQGAWLSAVADLAPEDDPQPVIQRLEERPDRVGLCAIISRRPPS